MAVAHAPVSVLPEGGLWRRATTQLATRLGVFPGDRVLVAAPASHDPTPEIARRMPRARFWGVHFAASGTGGAMHIDLARPPFRNEAWEAILLVLALPTVSAAERGAWVTALAPTLAPFGKWAELVAPPPGDKEALPAALRTLKDMGFEKVREMRLGLGRLGVALHLVTARWPGLDDDGGAQ